MLYQINKPSIRYVTVVRPDLAAVKLSFQYEFLNIFLNIRLEPNTSTNEDVRTLDIP